MDRWTIQTLDGTHVGEVEADSNIHAVTIAAKRFGYVGRESELVATLARTQKPTATQRLAKQFIAVERQYREWSENAAKVKAEADRVKKELTKLSTDLIEHAMHEHAEKVKDSDDGMSVLYIATPDGDHLRLATDHEGDNSIEIVNFQPA